MNLIFPKIITGGSLESLFYAYLNEIPIIITQPYIPFELEKLDEPELFEMLGYNNNVELTKIQVWDRLVFVLSMAGLVLMPNSVRGTRQEKNKLIFSLQDNTRYTIMYERKISFDKHIDGKLNVYDWFDIKSGSKVEIDQLVDDESDLVKTVTFYNSSRRGNGGFGRKDLVSLSLVEDKDLLLYENSENNVRLKTLRMMKEAGLKGKANGYNHLGKQLHYAIKLEHTHREIIKSYQPKYSMRKSYELAKQEKDIWKLTKKLLHHKQISILRESSRLRVDVTI